MRVYRIEDDRVEMLDDASMDEYATNLLVAAKLLKAMWRGIEDLGIPQPAVLIASLDMVITGIMAAGMTKEQIMEQVSLRYDVLAHEGEKQC